jgi:hypothetical protein
LLKMKKTIKLIAIVAVIGFSMAGCDWLLESLEEGPPEITTTSLPGGTVGTKYSKKLAASGEKPITWSFQGGILPAGLSLAKDGTISGTPTATGEPTFTVKATNAAGEATKQLSIKIAAPPTAPGVPTGVTATRVAGTPTTVRVTWTAVSGATGYKVYYSAEGTGTGTLEGSPTGTTFDSTGKALTGYHFFKVSAVNGSLEGNQSAQWVAPVNAPGAPVITTDSYLPYPTMGTPYSYTLTATGNAPITWTLDPPSWGSGELPPGLTLSSAGVISGTVTAEGSYTIFVRAANGSGSVTKALYLSVVSWTAVANIPFSETPYSPGIRSVVWGNNKFVAVGTYGQMLTSPDGITWTRVQDTKFTTDWAGSIYEIAWGNNKFIAMGSSQMTTSPDGTNWTVVGDNKLTSLSAITWGNNMFVAVGGSKMETSPDGTNWTLVEDAADYIFSGIKSIAWSGNKFVAVGGNNIITSPDGVTWTSVNDHGLGNQIEDIAWGNNKFVVIMSASVNDGCYMGTSPDGVTWTPVESTAGGSMSCIIWGNNKFVAGGILKVEYSENGTDWTDVSSRNFQSSTIWGVTCIAWGNNRFVAAGSDQMWYSANNW